MPEIYCLWNYPFALLLFDIHVCSWLYNINGKILLNIIVCSCKDMNMGWVQIHQKVDMPFCRICQMALT